MTQRTGFTGLLRLAVAGLLVFAWELSGPLATARAVSEYLALNSASDQTPGRPGGTPGAKPDFSGNWAPDVDPSAAAGAGGGGRGRGTGGGPLTIKQTATELTIERQGPNGPVSQVYKLDGSADKITMGQTEGTATATWDGSKLVITTKSSVGEQTQTWSLSNGVLMIERTGGRGPSSTTYRRAQ